MTDKILTGWLSPTGEFVPCPPYAHFASAQNILMRMPGVDTEQMTTTPDTALLNMGWAEICIASFFDHGFTFAAKRLTPEQVSFLEPYYNGDYGLGMTKMAASDYRLFKERL